MKRVIRKTIIDTFSLYICSLTASGMFFNEKYITLVFSGLSITLISLFAKPIINLLLLPINLITFGMFRWLSSVFVFYVVSLIISGFKIKYFSFPGYSNVWIDIPPIYLKGVLAIFAFSFLFSLISSFFHWLTN